MLIGPGTIPCRTWKGSPFGQNVKTCKRSGPPPHRKREKGDTDESSKKLQGAFVEQDGPPPHLDQGHEEYPSATFDTEAAHSSPGVRVLQLPPPGYATAAPHSPHPHPPPPPPPHHFQPQHEQPHIHPTVIHHPVPAVPHVPVGNNPAGGTNFLSLPAIYY